MQRRRLQDATAAAAVFLGFRVWRRRRQLEVEEEPL
jgi:hypothetical protein